MFIQFVQQLAVHPHLSELYYRGIQDFESLKGAEIVRFSAFMDQMFKLFEEAYHGQLERHMDARVWRGGRGGPARLQHISGRSGLVAYTLALVQ
jgi:hypothetical protein